MGLAVAELLAHRVIDRRLAAVEPGLGGGPGDRVGDGLRIGVGYVPLGAHARIPARRGDPIVPGGFNAATSASLSSGSNDSTGRPAASWSNRWPFSLASARSYAARVSRRSTLACTRRSSAAFASVHAVNIAAPVGRAPATVGSTSR